ncbi:type II toxin-antitoxin system ParD family antitoxin [Spirulina sp.]|jgi:Arc/MetJ-type ribon-helix-helix transcriptional regulator|uniref:type II toxin-antitoxin system ParD family antitoxin n=1 Tax=Spirulina sp. TaxID=1157 RepID=UPI003F71F312
MQLPLSKKLQEFTDQQLASGKYFSLNELLIAGLEALAERELIYQGRFEELRHEVLLGAVEAEQGILLESSGEIADIRQRLRQKHSSQ